jgi:hypothetical protein
VSAPQLPSSQQHNRCFGLYITATRLESSQKLILLCACCRCYISGKEVCILAAQLQDLVMHLLCVAHGNVSYLTLWLQPSLKQFALTRAELAARERAEEMIAPGLEPQGSESHSASTSLGRPASAEGSGGGLGRAMSLLAGVWDLVGSPPTVPGRGSSALPSSPPSGASPSVETGLLKSLSAKRRSTGDGRLSFMPGSS